MTEPMATARRWATATTLQDGRVLIAGGGYAGTTIPELFDQSLMSFQWMEGTSHVAALATATLLADGDVLVAGGNIGELDPVSEARLFHVAPPTAP